MALDWHLIEITCARVIHIVLFALLFIRKLVILISFIIDVNFTLSIIDIVHKVFLAYLEPHIALIEITIAEMITAIKRALVIIHWTLDEFLSRFAPSNERLSRQDGAFVFNRCHILQNCLVLVHARSHNSNIAEAGADPNCVEIEPL